MQMPTSTGNRAMEKLRETLSRPDALLQLSVLGILCGVLAGLVIVALRLLIETTQLGFLPGGSTESYETLPIWARFALPAAGGLVIGLIFHLFAQGQVVSGVVELMERMAYHQGYLSVRRLLLQFFGAAISIISGHSVGREGPSIHLGGASASLLGQWLSLPNNSIRTLVGCGCAAAIAASFNTPLAGVIFSLEVIMLEYTLASFTPVILSAVSATAISQWLLGTDSLFQIPSIELRSLSELPIIFLMGITIGCMATLFIQLTKWFASTFRSTPFWMRTTAAGVLIGIVSTGYPEVMGTGYDTINGALLGQLGFGLVIGVTVAKLFATASCIGLGIPGGLIAPTLFIGSTLGALVGAIVHSYSGDVSSNGLYALLGMGAMMGATLQAPLAALVAMMELTSNPYIILPGMLAVVTAGLTSSELFHQKSVFVTLLKARGLNYDMTPVMQALRRVGVASTMNRSLVRLERHLTIDKANQALEDDPQWIVIYDDGPVSLMHTIDLVRHLQADGAPTAENDELDLMAIPARRLQLATTHYQASLQEALDTLQKEDAEIVLVERMTAPMIKIPVGVLTQEAIDAAYHH